MSRFPTLYEQLAPADQTQRRDIAARVIAGLLGGDASVNANYLGLCEHIIADQNLMAEDNRREAWKFSPENSARLLRNTTRLQDFLGAIARAPQAERIIDAGTGDGERTVSVQADLYDARDRPVLTRRQGHDIVTQPMTLGSVNVPRPGTPIDFRYRTGSELLQTPATLWVSS